MLGPPKESHRDELFLDSLEHRLPATNCYRKLQATLDLSFVRDWVADKYAAIGRPSIDPVVFFQLQLILFFEGIRSERLLMETADLNIAHRWYLGYGWNEPLPDHSRLTKIRQRIGLAAFQRVFDAVVERCQAAGLVWGKELFFDGTKVRANADADSLTPRFAQAAREHLAQRFEGDAAHDAEQSPSEASDADQLTPGPTVATSETLAPDAVPGSTDVPPAGGDTTVIGVAAPIPLPFAGTPEAKQQLAAENQAQWKLLEQHRLDPKRPPSGSPGGYRRITDFRVSTTDPDATPLNTGEAMKLGYHDHFHEKAGGCQALGGGPARPSRLQAPIPAILPPGALSKFRNRLLDSHQVLARTTAVTISVAPLPCALVRGPVARCGLGSCFAGVLLTT
jgi:transposase